MSVVIDSNAPYSTEFPLRSVGDAVYMTAEDAVLGHVFAIVYRAHKGVTKLSVILIGAHGTSGYVDMTLDRTSRYFGACKGLAPSHYKSPVRRALAIAALRTYATMDKPLLQKLRGSCDESAAAALGSRFRLVYGKFPGAIGARVLDAGLICPKRIESTIVDIVYEDSDATIEQNNELVYLLGEQLEQLFDPLSEYSPEPTERLYAPPVKPMPNESRGSSSSESSHWNNTLDAEPKEVQDLCEELYLLQAHARGDILDLLQSSLIPLRIEVLKGRFPGVSIARLNSVFPPTIDELFRVNNIFYESLRAALPFGAFEVAKACGATIPYFFKACMRHEAATQHFSQLLAELHADVAEVQEYMVKADSEKIERVIRNPSHLSSIKATLDKLIASKQWTAEEKRQIDEFYAVAAGTVKAFSGESESKPRAPRKLNSSTSFTGTLNGNENNQPGIGGKLLGEIAQDWPTELEYGWVNRRVVSVFDAVDVLEPEESLRQLHTVFIVFTDSLVVCRPSEPIPATSLSGLHVPSVGDMLMHAMLNEAPLDKNLPPLRVIAWAPILDVQFASYNKQHLYVFSPGIVGAFKLLQPDSDSNNLVTLLSKAKITTKTQPFHLFKVSGPQTSIYSTVQELHGYRQEINRTNVALFLSTDITERALSQFGLVGAVSLRINDRGMVNATVVSKMRYSGSFEVAKKDLQELVVNELAFLTTLSLSSQNTQMLDIIVASNRLVANWLIKWASQSEETFVKGHKLKLLQSKPVSKPADRVSALTTAEKNQNAMESLNEDITKTRSLRKIDGKIPPNQRDLSRIPEEDEPRELDKELQVQSLQSGSMSSKYSDISDSSQPESEGQSELSLEEAEQRDVDNWYHQLSSRRDDESLSSLSDADISGHSFKRTHSNSSSIQIGGFLDAGSSSLYNKNAGRAFPRLEQPESMKSIDSHRRQETESSFETIASLQDSDLTESSAYSGITTISEEEDFSYLASLVNATSFNSRLNELERNEKGIYPDLRETSLVRLGSYILRNEKSQKDMRNATLDTIMEQTSAPLGDDEETPTLRSKNFIAAEEAKVVSLYTPFADVEKNDWHPKPVKSGTTAALSGLLPQVNRYADLDEDSFDDEFGNEIAKRYLTWAEGSGRPVSMMSTRALNEFMNDTNVEIPDTPKRSLPDSKSQQSFRRMVMSSSLHTLQLASFVVQVDQRELTSSGSLTVTLRTLKKFVTGAYRLRETSPEKEKALRKQLCGHFFLLLRYECQQLALGLLEIEWFRRSRVAERNPELLPELWTHQAKFNIQK